jgi:hypothetical protein
VHAQTATAEVDRLLSEQASAQATTRAVADRIESRGIPESGLR